MGLFCANSAQSPATAYGSNAAWFKSGLLTGGFRFESTGVYTGCVGQICTVTPDVILSHTRWSAQIFIDLSFELVCFSIQTQLLPPQRHPFAQIQLPDEPEDRLEL